GVGGGGGGPPGRGGGVGVPWGRFATGPSQRKPADYKSAATMSTRRVADLPFGPVVRPRRADGRGLSLQRSALDLRTYHIGAEGEQGDVERGEKRDERLHGKPYVWSVRAGGRAEDAVHLARRPEAAAAGAANR